MPHRCPRQGKTISTRLVEGLADNTCIVPLNDRGLIKERVGARLKSYRWHDDGAALFPAR